MREQKKSRVIYGDAPFIQDMGVLTMLCLLHDEVMLFGSKSLDEHLQDHWEQHKNMDDAQSVAERMLEVLLPEKIVSFYSPDDAAVAFPGSNDLELPGILEFEEREINGKKSIFVKTDNSRLNDLSKLVLGGFADGKRTVSALLRDASVISTASKAGIPIVCKKAHIAVAPTSSRVSEVAMFLAHRAFQRLALPELEAYDPEDILEARLKLNSELQEFRAGILELVWLLHQKADIGAGQLGLGRECDILIDTKIAPAVGQFERAMAAHDSKKIRRILKTTGGALLELGKSLLSPTWSGALVAGSGAILKVAEGLETKQPSIQIASFMYKVSSRRY
ncbi:hypothetical protein [Comamonas sp.]|uniref:hypothetical protein n=1 Tax=Comamonas sp. TaxID=34028 RepID=UPI003D0DD25D